MRPCGAPRWRAAWSAPIRYECAPSSASPRQADNTRLRRGDGRIEGGHALAFLEDIAMMGSQAYCIGPRQCEGLAMDDASRSDKTLHRAAATLGRTKSLNRSRSTVFWILPVAVCGISSTKTTSSGIHQLAIFPHMNFKISSLVAD